jgi:hypothetical protein
VLMSCGAGQCNTVQSGRASGTARTARFETKPATACAMLVAGRLSRRTLGHDPLSLLPLPLLHPQLICHPKSRRHITLNRRHCLPPPPQLRNRVQASGQDPTRPSPSVTQQSWRRRRRRRQRGGSERHSFRIERTLVRERRAEETKGPCRRHRTGTVRAARLSTLAFLHRARCVTARGLPRLPSWLMIDQGRGAVWCGVYLCVLMPLLSP